MVKEGQPFWLQCVLSKTDQNATWLKNGDVLDPTGYAAVRSGLNYTLSKSTSCLDDGAKYSLRCDDKQTTCELTVQGKCVWHGICSVM